MERFLLQQVCLFSIVLLVKVHVTFGDESLTLSPENNKFAETENNTVNGNNNSNFSTVYNNSSEDARTERSGSENAVTRKTVVELPETASAVQPEAVTIPYYADKKEDQSTTTPKEDLIPEKVKSRDEIVLPQNDSSVSISSSGAVTGPDFYESEVPIEENASDIKGVIPIVDSIPVEVTQSKNKTIVLNKNPRDNEVLKPDNIPAKIVTANNSSDDSGKLNRSVEEKTKGDRLNKTIRIVPSTPSVRKVDSSNKTDKTYNGSIKSNEEFVGARIPDNLTNVTIETTESPSKTLELPVAPLPTSPEPPINDAPLNEDGDVSIESTTEFTESNTEILPDSPKRDLDSFEETSTTELPSFPDTSPTFDPTTPQNENPPTTSAPTLNQTSKPVEVESTTTQKPPSDVHQFFIDLRTHTIMCLVSILLLLIAFSFVFFFFVAFILLIKYTCIGIFRLLKKLGLCIKKKGSSNRGGNEDVHNTGSLFPRCDVSIRPYVPGERTLSDRDLYQ